MTKREIQQWKAYRDWINDNNQEAYENLIPGEDPGLIQPSWIGFMDWLAFNL